jgi:hypothetical protein
VITIDKVISAIDTLRREKPELFDLGMEPVCSEVEVAGVESALGVGLPEEYRLLVTRVGSGRIGFTVIFSCGPQTEYPIIETNNMINLVDRKSFVAVSDDGTGGYYGFLHENGQCKSEIFYYDHDGDTINPTRYCNLYEYFLADAFKLDLSE